MCLDHRIRRWLKDVKCLCVPLICVADGVKLFMLALIYGISLSMRLCGLWNEYRQLAAAELETHRKSIAISFRIWQKNAIIQQQTETRPVRQRKHFKIVKQFFFCSFTSDDSSPSSQLLKTRVRCININFVQNTMNEMKINTIFSPFVDCIQEWQWLGRRAQLKRLEIII